MRETNIIEVINATNIVRYKTVIIPSRAALLGNKLGDARSEGNISLANNPKVPNAAKMAIIDDAVTNKEGGLFNAAEASLLDAKIQITYGKINRVFPIVKGNIDEFVGSTTAQSYGKYNNNP